MTSPPPIYRSSLFWSRVAAWCVAHAREVALAGLALLVLSSVFVAGAFRMTTDSDELISPKLPYRQAEAAFRQVFPGARANLVVVVDGETPELAEQAARDLTSAMAARTDLFANVRRPDGGDFFAANGLLFLPTEEVQARTEQLLRAQGFLGPLAYDPTLRGVMTTFGDFAGGVLRGDATLAQLDEPITALKAPLSAALEGETKPFSWRALMSDAPPSGRDLRKLILADPALDKAKLKAGAAASEFVRAEAARLGYGADAGVRVRLTGPAPLADEEFATLAENIALTTSLMVGFIILMLWFATHSVRAILAILLVTFTGLAVTAAVALLLFGRFNAISVAFIPLFVGLGIDFGIQYAVRFRAEQRDKPVEASLRSAGLEMGRPLTLASGAIALGFLAFVPTQYSGVSQLGAIAGLGMLIALALSLTLLPALLRLLTPKGSLPEERVAWLDAVDSYVLGRRSTVLGISGVAAAACLGLAPLLTFDSNPLHLRSEKTESVSTFLDLSSDPTQSPDAINVVAPSLEAAGPLTEKLSALPEVDRVVSLARFIPADQDTKLAYIQDADFALGPSLSPFETAPAPTDEDTIAALRVAASRLREAADKPGEDPAAAGDARSLAETVEALAGAPPEARERASAALIPPLETTLDQVRQSLLAQPIDLDTLPEELKRQWLSPDGRARLSVIPAGDTGENVVREAFADAVRSIAPNASGPPVAQIEAEKIVVGAFVTAGVLSFLAITALLFVALRRPIDVAITMAPIVLTGLLTIGSAVVIGQPLNFANIIALPLLFGMGVAFHIYFVTAWRDGQAHLLNSSLARAVFFSALSSATGFGSLWLSSHPGTASMGELLLISLLWTLVSALLFQPALMGPPPKHVGAPGGALIEAKGKERVDSPIV